MLSIRNLSLVAENGEETKELLKDINLDIDDLWGDDDLDSLYNINNFER